MGHPQAGSVRVRRSERRHLQWRQQEETVHRHRHDWLPRPGAAGEPDTTDSSGLRIVITVTQASPCVLMCLLFTVCTSGRAHHRHGSSLQTLPLELHHERHSGQTSRGSHLTQVGWIVCVCVCVSQWCCPHVDLIMSETLTHFYFAFTVWRSVRHCAPVWPLWLMDPSSVWEPFSISNTSWSFHFIPRCC